MKKKSSLLGAYDNGGALAGKIGAATGAASTLVDIVDTGQGPYGAPKAGTAGLKAGLSGAAAGASIGSVIPGIGTAVGAVVGGVAGAVSGFLGAKKQQKIAKTQSELMSNNARKASQSQYAARVAADPTLSRGNLAATYFEDGGNLRRRKPGTVIQTGDVSATGNMTFEAPPVGAPAWGGAEYDARNYAVGRNLDPITGLPRVPIVAPVTTIPQNRAVEPVMPITRERLRKPVLSAPTSHYANGGDLPLHKLSDQFLAGGGGLSRDKDYGSKDKPYPSVGSNDFAGGGRSYPIPTRADAVDALRLAGLHGRSDVRAKVFAKYPDLKKENGGSLAQGFMGKF